MPGKKTAISDTFLTPDKGSYFVSKVNLIKLPIF